MLETLTGFALKGFRCSNRAPSGEQLAGFPLILRGGKKKTPTKLQKTHSPVLKSKIISKLFSHLTLPLVLNQSLPFSSYCNGCNKTTLNMLVKENDEHNEHEYKLLTMFFIATFGIKDNAFSYCFNYFRL